MNPLEQLIIDHWYKAMLTLSTVLLILSLTVDIRVISNESLALLSTGLIFISLGEWINHPLQTALFNPLIDQTTTYKLTSNNRKPCRLGNLFNILGGLFVCMGAVAVYRFFSH